MKFATILLVAYIIPVTVCSQIISTIGGNGVLGDSGDGGAATLAKLSNPYACSIDKNGNCLFSEVSGNRIRKITPEGNIFTIAGSSSAGYGGDGGPATLAKLDDPTGITIDTENNIYIVDKLNQRIRKINTATGTISTIAGNGTAGYGGENVLADTSMLNNPQDICFDARGNLYVLDDVNYRIRRINSTGMISTVAGNGLHGYSGDGGPAINAEIQDMAGICVDSLGDIFFSQRMNYVVRKVDTAGIITTIAGNGLLGPLGDGLSATSASLDPERLIFDDSGNLYISCYLNNNIRKIDVNGIIHTIAGSGIAGYSGDGGIADTAELHIPIGIALDNCENLYIADQDNNKIRKVSFYPSCIVDSLTLDAKMMNTNTLISLYPNPACTQVTITSATNILEVTITNLIGQQVLSQVYDMERAEINVAALPPGVYVVRVTDGNGNETIRKVVKE